MIDGPVDVLDDDPAVRDAIRAMLDAEGATARSHDSAQRLLEALASGETPAAVLLDINLAGSDGLDLLPAIRARAPGAPVLVMTGHAEVSLAVRAMKCGAADFLEKPFDAETLLTALTAATSRAAARDGLSSAQTEAHKRIARLTEREREVFDQLLRGGGYKAIARTLGVSPRTVETHRAHIMEKTGCGNLAQIFQLAVAAGVAPVYERDED